jgi:immune inhibitor A
VAGYPGSPPLAFANRPDIQLTSWSTHGSEVLRHYQAAYLFLRYAAERGGGWDALPRIMATCARGEAQFGSDFDSLFGDWTVANLVQDPKIADGRYAYADGSFRATQTGGLRRDTPFQGSVAQFAADYVSLPTAQARLRFSGQPTVSLITPSTQGGVWWSNRGDAMDARLTRSVDLRSVSQATARFRVSYELEDRFDFVYLTVSTDGGGTWQSVPGSRAQADQETGNNFGQGWTGSTDGAWVQEQVDLSPFVGQEVLLRFEYVTDQANNGEGFSFADFEIPELDVREPGAAAGAWQSEGWLRVEGDVPERWLLHLVRWTADGVHVDPVNVDADGIATFDVDPTATRSTLVVAPAAPRTSLPAAYQVEVVG